MESLNCLMVFRHHSKYKSGDGDGGPIWRGGLVIGGLQRESYRGFVLRFNGLNGLKYGKL